MSGDIKCSVRALNEISHAYSLRTHEYLLIMVDDRCVAFDCYIKIILARKDPMKINDTITFTINYFYYYILLLIFTR